MTQPQLSKIIDKAHAVCALSGGKLTDKRRRILEILLLSTTPMSAYEVTESYNISSDSSMPPMSVYRILEYLESEQLVHKLSSTNKYVACSHIVSSHFQQIPQFLICELCQSVSEIMIPQTLVAELKKQLESVGYKLASSKLELQCVCKQCGAG